MVKDSVILHGLETMKLVLQSSHEKEVREILVNHQIAVGVSKSTTEALESPRTSLLLSRGI